MPPGAAPGSRRLGRGSASLRALALQLSWPAAAVSRVDGNLPFAVDFRDLYATVLERWWGADSTRALKGRFVPLDVVRA